MAKVGNESTLILRLAKEKMDAKLLNRRQMLSNPDTNSNDANWMAGYQCAFNEWNQTLMGVVVELERR